MEGGVYFLACTLLLSISPLNTLAYTYPPDYASAPSRGSVKLSDTRATAQNHQVPSFGTTFFGRKYKRDDLAGLIIDGQRLEEGQFQPFGEHPAEPSEELLVHSSRFRLPEANPSQPQGERPFLPSELRPLESIKGSPVAAVGESGSERFMDHPVVVEPPIERHETVNAAAESNPHLEMVEYVEDIGDDDYIEADDKTEGDEHLNIFKRRPFDILDDPSPPFFLDHDEIWNTSPVPTKSDQIPPTNRKTSSLDADRKIIESLFTAMKLLFASMGFEAEGSVNEEAEHSFFHRERRSEKLDEEPSEDAAADTMKLLENYEAEILQALTRTEGLVRRKRSIADVIGSILGAAISALIRLFM